MIYKLHADTRDSNIDIKTGLQVGRLQVFGWSGAVLQKTYVTDTRRRLEVLVDLQFLDGLARRQSALQLPYYSRPQILQNISNWLTC